MGTSPSVCIAMNTIERCNKTENVKDCGKGAAQVLYCVCAHM